MYRYFKLVTFFALAYACHIRNLNASTGFNDLPDDVKRLIFSKTQINDEGVEERILKVQDLGRCARVCKAWQNPASSDLLWQRFAVAHFNMGVIPRELYGLYSKTAKSILSEAPIYKKMLHYKNVIRFEIGKEAVDLYNEGAIHLESMVILELLGDVSLITDYLQKKSTMFELTNDFEMLRASVHALVALGSKIAPEALQGLG